MTREEKLISMNGTLLIEVADKLGVKVACDKSRRSLKEAKANVVKRILEAEAEQNQTENVVSEETTEAPQEPVNIPDTTEEKYGRKPRITITYKGVTKTPNDWAKEFDLNPKYIRSQLRKGKTPEEIFNGKNK